MSPLFRVVLLPSSLLKSTFSTSKLSLSIAKQIITIHSYKRPILEEVFSCFRVEIVVIPLHRAIN